MNASAQPEIKPLDFEAVNEHSILSASGMSRWSKCTISPYMESSYPETTNKWSELGTLWHSAIEDTLSAYLESDTDSKEIEDHYDVNIIKEFRKAEGVGYRDPKYAQSCVDYSVEVYQRLLKVDPSTRMWTEIPLDFSNLLATLTYAETLKGLYGTADILIIGGGELHLIDYKNGGVFVSEKKSDQLSYYFSAAIFNRITANYIQQTMTDFGGLSLSLTIVQPHCAQPIRTWQPTLPYLMDWFKNDLVKVVTNIKAGHVTYFSGPHCRYCKHIQNCSEPGELIEKAKLENKSEKVTVPESRTKQAFKAMAPEDMQKALGDIEVLQSYISAIEATVTEHLKGGGTVEGYKVVTTRPKKIWVSEKQAFAEWKKACKIKGLKAADFYNKVPITPSQALSALGEEDSESLKEQTFLESKSLKLVKNDCPGIALNKSGYGGKPFTKWI